MDKLLGKPQIGFVQLTKYNEATGAFEGVMASSAPDQSSEVLDWGTSIPHFRRWIERQRKISNGKSLGNVREMHQPIAAGVLTKVYFDNDQQSIYVWGKATHRETMDKLATGTLTGLSIGGDYGKRWPDPQNPKLTRYEARPYEVSLVDNPCNPDAVLMLAGRDGTEKMVKFAATALEFEASAVDDEDEAQRLQKGDRPSVPQQQPGVTTMSPDAIVAQELQKQENEKAEKFAVLGALIKGVKKLRKRFKKFGTAGGLSKSYVSSIQGFLNDLSGQIGALQSAFTPAVAAGMPSSPGNSQPGENVGGGSGDMVTTSPSASGTGEMHPGVGMRAGAGLKDGKKGKKGLSKKKLEKLLTARDANLQKMVADTIAAIMKPPSPEDLKRMGVEVTTTAGTVPVAAPDFTAPTATGAAPVRLMKDAADANKVGGTAAGGADDSLSVHVIAELQKRANDSSDPVAAAKATDELNKVTDAAVRKALRDTAQVPIGSPGFRSIRKAQQA